MPKPAAALAASTTAALSFPVLFLLLLLSSSAPRGADAVTATPDKPPVSIPLDDATIKWMSQFVPPGTPAPDKYDWPFNYPGFLPWTDPRIRKTVKGCAPEQVHLNYWSEPSHVAESGGRLSVLLSYTTCDSFFGENGPAGPRSTAGAKSEVWVRINGRFTKRTGMAYSYENSWRATEAETEVKYTSPLIHHVLLKGLKPGQRVDYVIPNVPQPVGGDEPAAAAGRRRRLAESASQQQPANSGGKQQRFPPGSYVGFFVVPKQTFPFKIAAVGDAGQMDPNATVALSNLVKMQPDLVLSLGDNAYHDDPGTEDGQEEFRNFIKPQDFQYTDRIGFYSPRWESFHRLYSRLFARVPVIQTPGNHELNPEPWPLSGSKFADVESFVSRFKDYNAYWPSPQFPELTRDGPTVDTLQPVGPATSPDPDSGMQNRNQFHAHTIPGIATIISLSNYIIWEAYGEAQLEWLNIKLAEVDREKTPWLVVIWHASWYATYSKHWKETECMRRAYEPLFRQYGVDVVLNGHNHAYERSKPVYAWEVDQGCGTVHLMAGGGCADDLTFGVIDEEEMMPYLPLKPSTCPADPTKDKVCPYTYCRDQEKFNIPGYQPPMLSKSKYEKAPACALPDPQYPDPLCPQGGVQPAWSAYREATYGVGQLELLSPTKARWSFYANNRNKNGPKSATDSVILTRTPGISCPPPPPPPP